MSSSDDDLFGIVRRNKPRIMKSSGKSGSKSILGRFAIRRRKKKTQWDSSSDEGEPDDQARPHTSVPLPPSTAEEESFYNGSAARTPARTPAHSRMPSRAPAAPTQTESKEEEEDKFEDAREYVETPAPPRQEKKEDEEEVAHKLTAMGYTGAKGAPEDKEGHDAYFEYWGGQAAVMYDEIHRRKKGETQAPPPPPTPSALPQAAVKKKGRDRMLDDIKGGAKLKKAPARKLWLAPPEAVDPKKELAAKLASVRAAVAGDSDSGPDDAWKE